MLGNARVYPQLTAKAKFKLTDASCWFRVLLIWSGDTVYHPNARK